MHACESNVENDDKYDAVLYTNGLCDISDVFARVSANNIFNGELHRSRIQQSSFTAFSSEIGDLV